MALTDTKLRGIKGTGERREYPDRDALVLRVSATGTKTWTVSYRVRGRGDAAGERVARLAGDKRRLTLGDYPTISLSEARARAAEVKRLARAGHRRRRRSAADAATGAGKASPTASTPTRPNTCGGTHSGGPVTLRSSSAYMWPQPGVHGRWRRSNGAI